MLSALPLTSNVTGSVLKAQGAEHGVILQLSEEAWVGKDEGTDEAQSMGGLWNQRGQEPMLKRPKGLKTKKRGWGFVSQENKPRKRNARFAFTWYLS